MQPLIYFYVEEFWLGCIELFSIYLRNKQLIHKQEEMRNMTELSTEAAV